MSLRSFGASLCTHKKRFALYTLGILTLLLSCGYLFVMHTNRGSSLALYVAGGWNAPIGVKIACGKETDAAVIRKFEQPLAFDAESINKLKGFWYYSFYRGCLFAHGYDFKGNAIPSSTVTKNTDTGHYENTYGGFAFSLQGSTVLAQDNLLDVEYDDQMLQSVLETTYGTLDIQTFLKHDTWKTAEDIATRYFEEPFGTASTTVFETHTTASGIPLLFIREESGTERFLVMSKRGYVVHLFTSFSSESLLEELLATLSDVS